MAPVARRPDHGPMTTEQTDLARPIEQAGGARHLRRRTTDRVIGGVAGGLGDYLNVDPVLLRAAFAGLMIFGGAGLVLYVLGWLLIPAGGHDQSIGELALRRLLGGGGRIVAAILFLALIVIVVSPWSSDGYTSYYVPAEVFVALAVALLGIALLLPREHRNVALQAAIPADPGMGAAATGVAAAPVPAVAWRAAPPRERSPLGWYVLAGVLLILGALAATDTVAAVRVVPGQYFGAGILALGIGLVVGSWWGRARLLILLGLVVLPVAAGSAFLTVPLEGGIGDHSYRPRSLVEVQPEYRIAGGRLSLDLTDLAGSEPVALDASVGVGDLFVIVPKHAAVQVTGTVQGGRLWLFGREHVGTGLADRVSEPGDADGDGGTIVLTLDAGIGQVWVERTNMESD